MLMPCYGRPMIDDAALRPDQARSAAVSGHHAPLTAEHDQGVAALWRAVLLTALADASRLPRVRKHIAGWLFSPNFWFVVDAAGVDPRRTASAFKLALSAPARPLRAPRGGRPAGTRRQQVAA